MFKKTLFFTFLTLIAINNCSAMEGDEVKVTDNETTFYATILSACKNKCKRHFNDLTGRCDDDESMEECVHRITEESALALNSCTQELDACSGQRHMHEIIAADCHQNHHDLKHTLSARYIVIKERNELEGTEYYCVPKELIERY